ncbi:MAG TPA: Ig-like domain-containing protein [Burkholderiaceae bacterium]
MAIIALGACGGGSGSPPSATTVNALSDSATVPWNTATNVDVLANDTVSAGVLTVSAVTAPMHGSASIVGTSIQYIPTAGYFGPDSLTYTARASDGTTASAVLDLTVTAKVTLGASVFDGPLAGAAVSVAVGNRRFNATADGNGAYSVDITSAAPADVVVVSAVGTGAQSQVKLRSLLGEMASLVKLVTSNGSLGADQLASANVTNVSTALAALVEEANAGQTPATLAQLGALSVRMSPQSLLDLATAIKLVSDYGVSLPAGVSDTAALVAQPSTSSVLASFLASQEGSASGNFTAARQLISAGSSLPTGAVALPKAATQTLVYFAGHKKSSALTLKVSYAPDGTAQVLGPDGASGATWVQAAGVLTLTLAQPFNSVTAAIYDPVTASYVTASVQTTGFQILQLAGTPSGGIAMVRPLGQWTVLQGTSTGEVIPFSAANLGVMPVAVIDLAAAPALTSTELTVGANWAGLIVGQDASGLPEEDILSITGSSAATFVRMGGQATWSLANGVLKIAYGGFEYDYQRLLAAAPTGEEQWLVTTLQNGSVTTAGVQMVAKASTDLKFSASSNLNRAWLSGIGENIYFDLYADGTGSQKVGLPQVPATTSPLTWSVGTGGTITIIRTRNGTVVNEHTWTLVGQQAGSILVMEDLVASGTDSWRLNIYADGGAASP